MGDEYTYLDFTTASEWEIFIARLEEIIQEWRLPQKPLEKKLEEDDFKKREWCTSSEKITFADITFEVARYYLKSSEDENSLQENRRELDDCSFNQALNDMLSVENDFFPITIPPKKDSHPLARWYGLRDFLVLSPKLGASTVSESQVKLWLSSLCISTNNTNCQIPFFIEIKQSLQYYFLGVCQSKGFHTDFEMIHLRHLPIHYQYLTGLLTLFKSKIGMGPGKTSTLVTVAVRFSYHLKDWSIGRWPQNPAGFEITEDVGLSNLSKLPFGAVFDPIQGLYLYTTWPCHEENLLVDSEYYSDLNPMTAQVWTISIDYVENVSCLLTDYFVEFLSLSNDTRSTYQLLGSLVDCAPVNDLSSSLSAITESKMSAFSKTIIGTGRNSREQPKQIEQQEGPIPSDILMLLLYYLFPDADPEYKWPYSEQYTNSRATPGEDKKSQRSSQGFDTRLNGMKSAPFDSLPWRLAIAMACVINSEGGVRSATHLWYEFSQELAFRCENSILIPGLEPSAPEHRTCLLNQKLQLLNCCINKKIERDKRAKRNEDDSDSEEEFYDCLSDADMNQEDSRKKKTRSTTPEKPMGRLARHGELRLLETGEFLYIPKVQDAIPKTEDQLDEDAEVLLQLGTDAQGSEMRARLMSASLLSDMEAFKAANPGCILADFIRWYSPRDWIQDEGVNEYGQPKGHLSNRMKIPGNTWLEVWEMAKPSPIKWQKRLFNDTRESEKALTFFRNQNPKGFIELLLPVMSVCVIQKLIEESNADELGGAPELISKLIKRTEMLQRQPAMVNYKYKDLINDICAIETLLIKANSLKHKFLAHFKKEEESKTVYDEVISFTKNLLTSAETKVPGPSSHPLRCLIQNYFLESTKSEQMRPGETNMLTKQNKNAASSFPSPFAKEMILRCSTSDGPQRLHAVLNENDFRLCGAFTKNDTFF